MHRLLRSGGSAATGITTVVAGARLHHLEEGSGRAVILVHGGTGGGANWFRVMPGLARSYRVLAPDLPGFGLSDPVEPMAPLGHVAAALLARWLDALDLRDAIVAGTSFGGLAALRLAQRVPDRVAGLLLLDSAGLGRGLHPLVRLATLPGVTRYGAEPTVRGTRALFERLLTANRRTLSAGQIDALLDFLYLSARRAGTSYLARTLRLFATPLGQREVVTAAELRALPQQVAVVWGALDRLLPPRHAEHAARHCRAATLTVIPDAGHSPNWETPDRVVAAIGELARHG
jgi:pimeloyl-ACP methyl ester carboxylesterase